MDEIETIGSVYLFAGTFAPVNWMFCDGRLLYIPEYPALFSVIQFTYGGDGINVFALPDLRGRTPIGEGQGKTAIYRHLGEKGGKESIALTLSEIPMHTHKARAVSQVATKAGPIGNLWAQESNYATAPYRNAQPDTEMYANAIYPTGEGREHENRQPYLVLQYIICVYGLYPVRN